MPTQFFRCPACNSQMDVSATSCPICLRPRSRQEMLRDLQNVKRAEKSKRRWLLATLAVAAGATAVALHPEWLARLKTAAAPIVAPVAQKAKAKMEDTVKADWPGAAPGGLVPVTPQQSFDRNSNLEAAAASAPPSPAPPVPMPAPSATKTPPPLTAGPAENAPPTQWTVDGSIYGILDLKPGAGVEVLFTPTNGDPPKKTVVKADGKYRISLPILPAGGGYKIELLRRRRSLPYLEEAALPYRDRTKSQREDAVDEASQAPVLHAPLSPEALDTRQDFALLPTR